MNKLENAIMILLAITASLPKRWGIGGSSLSIFDFAIFFGCCFFVLQKVFSYRSYHQFKCELGDRKFFALLTVPFIVAMVSICWSIIKFRTLETAVKYLIAMLAFLLPVNFLREKSLGFVEKTWIVFACGLILGPVGFYLRIPGFDLYNFVGKSHAAALFGAFARMSHPFIGPSNDFAPILALIVFLFIGLGWFINSKPILGLSLLLSILLILTFSRGVLLAVSIAGALLAVYLFRAGLMKGRHLVRFSVAVAIVLVSVVVVVRNYGVSYASRHETLVQVVVKDRTSSANIDSRIEKYENTIQQILARPFLGLGGGVFSAKGQTEGVIAAHDTYLENFVFFGLPLGTVVNLSLLLMLLRLRKLLVENEEMKLFLSFIVAGFLMILIAAAAETFMEATVPRILVFFVMGLFFATLNSLRTTSVDR